MRMTPTRALMTFLVIFLSSSHAFAYGDEKTNKDIEEAVKSQNYEALFRLVEPHAEGGDAKAQFHFCILHWHGLGVISNAQKAISWCKKASHKKSKAEKYAEFIEVALKKTGATQTSKSKIIEALRVLAENGNGEAQWLMHQAHDDKMVEFNKRDKQARKKWLNMAVENDYPPALVSVAREWFTSDDPNTQEKFVSYMQRAAKQKNAEAMYLLGSFYQPWEINGEAEEPQRDYEKSIYWYRKSAKIDGQGAFELSKLLRSRVSPIQDHDEAFKWLKLAAEKDEQEAQVALAKLYEEGQTIRRNYAAAYKWYSRASSGKIYNFNFSHHSTSAFKVGQFLLSGIGVKKDLKSAFQVFKTISDHEYADKDYYRNGYTGLARYYTGYLYESGIGVEKDRETAEIYYKKAAEQGEILAVKKAGYLASSKTVSDAVTIRAIQAQLNKLGYRAGPPDGVFGFKTFEAIRAFQCAISKKVIGTPSREVLAQITNHRNRDRKFSREIWNEKLFEAISQADIDCITAALVNGADPNATKHKNSPLWMSIFAQPDASYDDWDLRDLKVNIAKLLVSYGAKPNAYNSGLFSAISNGNVGFLKILLENRVSPIAKISGKRLIDWAAYYDQPDIEKLLVEFGATKISARQMAQERLVNSQSIFGGGTLKAQEALKAGAHINMTAADGTNALVSSVRNGVYTLGALNYIKFLLESGADPNQEANGNFQDLEGIPLHIFVYMNQHSMNEKDKSPKSRKNAAGYATKAMHLLLDRGANIASRDKKGRTPLHWAAKSDNLAAAKILIKKGAIRTHRDKTGALPLDYAESAEMIALLKGVVSEESRPKKEANGTGSGFLVSKSGHIVTNAHVVNGCDAINFGVGSGKTFPARLISMDTNNDLALLKPLKTAGYALNATNVNSIRGKDVNLGESIIVAGFPYGALVSSSIKITSGIVSSVKGFNDNSSQFQIDAAVQPGNSGGPIYDKQGNVVGIVVAQLNKIKMAKASGSMPENTNFGIKGSTLRTFLESASIKLNGLSAKNENSLEDVAQIASSSTLMINCVRE
jgi:TPR repeat protein/S1-C subfamily serine protease